MGKRKLEVAVISDLHLATHACKAKKILGYLKSINPSTLVLNGDIFDSWRFTRSYFPKTHLKVVRQIMKFMEKGVQVYYISGNHDEFIRRFQNTQIGTLKIVNQLSLELDHQKTWIFHGDLFDHVIHEARWLAKLGAAVYGFLTMLNKALNPILSVFSKKEIIIYKTLKKMLTRERNPLSKFEKAICNAAQNKKFDSVIVGHTHLPKDKKIVTPEGIFHYLNCGDWVEHFTAVEYYDHEWHLHYYEELEDMPEPDDIHIPEKFELYSMLFSEFSMDTQG